MDCSLPSSSVHGISQARILEWVAIPFSRGSSRARDWTWVSCIAGGFFTLWASLMGGVILWRKPEKNWERFNRRAEERECWFRWSGKSLSEEVIVMGSSNEERWCCRKWVGWRCIPDGGDSWSGDKKEKGASEVGQCEHLLGGQVRGGDSKRTVQGTGCGPCNHRKGTRWFLV